MYSMKAVFALFAFASVASAFIVQPGAIMVRAPSTSLGMGYVPDGLTPEQYKKIQAEKEAQIKASKTKKRGSVEDLTDFNRRQEKLNPNKPGAGHVFVKIKGKGKEGTTQSGLDWFGNKKK